MVSERRIEQLLEQIESNPEDLSLYIQYKNLCVQSKLFDEAEEAYELMIDLVTSQLQEALESTGEVPDLGLGESVFAFLAKNYFEWSSLIEKESPDRVDKQMELLKAALDADEKFEKAYGPLSKIYLSLHQYEEWLDLQEKAISFQKNKRVKIETLLQMKDIAEKIGEINRIIDYYDQLVQEDRPKSKEHFKQLEDLLTSLEEWEQLTRFYEKRLQERLDPRTKDEYTKKLLEIYQEKIPNKDKVFYSLCENYKKNPKNKDLREKLELMVEDAGMQEELLSFYENIVDIIPDKTVRKELLLKIGEILWINLEEANEAFDTYKRVLELDPSDPVAMGYQVDILNTRDDSEERSMQLVTLNNALGHYFMTRGKDDDRGTEAYYNVLQVDPENSDAYNALLKLFNRKKMWAEKSDLLKLKVDHIEGNEKGKIAFMLGELLYKELDHPDEAGPYFKVAYECGETKAISYIENISKDEENYDTLLQYKIDAIEHLKNPRERAASLKEIGEIYQDRMMDPVNAIIYFIRSLKSNPKDTDLAIKVIEYVYEMESYELLKDALVEVERAIAVKRDSHLYFKLGEIAYRVEDKKSAAHIYKKAADLDKKNFEVQWTLALLYEELEDWQKSLRLFQLIEKQFKQMEDEEHYKLYTHMGRVAFELSDRKAKGYIEKALSFSRENVDTLEYYYQLLESDTLFEDAVSVRLEVTDLISDEKKLIKLYTEIADIYKNKLNDQERYLEYYSEIFRIGANDKNQLLALLDTYTQNQNHTRSIEVLERLIEIEENSDQRIDYKFELLNIYENVLKDPGKTLGVYQELYEALPNDEEVIAGYERYLTGLNLWSQLITFYVSRIKHTSEHKNHKQFWLTIGDIYANRLGDFVQAATALEQALKIDSKNAQLRMVLVDIYSRTAGHGKRQIELLRRNIKDNPFKSIYYEWLFKIYIQERRLDEAYVTARIIRYFGKESGDHNQILEKFRGKNRLNWGEILTDYHWNLIFHHRLKNQVTDIFHAISVPMLQLYGRSEKSYKLSPRERIDIAKQKNVFGSSYNMISTFLNVPTPEVYIRKGVSGMNFLNIGRIVSQIGYDIFNNNDDKKVLYSVAKGLTYLRPEFILARLVPGTVLKNIFLGVLNYVIPTMNVAGDIDQLQAITTHLEKHTAPETLESIQKVVQAFVKGKGSIDLNKWLNAVEFTSNRIAFLFTQDLEMIQSMFKSETVGVLSKADYKVKMADLLNYSISDDYFQLRKELGLSIK